MTNYYKKYLKYKTKYLKFKLKYLKGGSLEFLKRKLKAKKKKKSIEDCLRQRRPTSTKYRKNRYKMDTCRKFMMHERSYQGTKTY